MEKNKKDPEYVLELYPGRALTGISHNTISFNLTGHMTFANTHEVEKFLNTWKYHFFGLHTLTVVETPETKK